jgi:molybdopterin converting factor small subunit
MVTALEVVVRIPSALRSHTGGKTQTHVDASTVEQALEALEERFPALVPFLRDESGALRPRVNIYVNDEHVRYRQGLRTPLQDGDTVLVTPIIMGG